MIGSRQPAYFDRTYQDALGLLIEARDYVELTHQAANEGTVAARSQDELVASREAFRLTTRLAEIMAWLLARKAVLNGELTQTEVATPKWRLGAQEICDEECGHDDDNVPPGLKDLLVRSHQLYTRVSRLDGRAQHTRNWPPTGNPPGAPNSNRGTSGPI